METIREKYTRLRPQIKQGDLILFHGNSLLSKVIQESDQHAYFNHVGVVGEIAGALFIIDSNRDGVQPARLSDRVFSYTNGDFVVFKPNKTKKEITKALSKLLIKTDYIKPKYDFINGLKSLINRFFGVGLKTKPNPNRVICSMFVLPYALELDMVYPLNDMNNLFYPEDYMRDLKNVTVIGI